MCTAHKRNVAFTYETQQCNSISKCKMHVCKAQLCIKFIYKYATHFAKTLGTVWQMLNHFNQLQTSFLFYFYSYPWLSRSSNILKHFSSQRSEQHNELSTCMEWKKMQGGWVAGVWGGILNKRPTMATCCTIIIAKARVKRYLVVKKLSPAIIQHSCQPARDAEVKKVPIIKKKKSIKLSIWTNASIMPFVHLHSEHIISDLFKREKGFKTPYKKAVKIIRKSPENWRKKGARKVGKARRRS